MRIRRYAFIAIAALLSFGALGGSAPAAAQVRATIGVDFFYDSLSPYGDWFVSADFGHVWRPRGVYTGWRPYSDGHWVWTDWGWAFVSDDPWGWAAYHYGRWDHDPYYGWIWVPGYEWAPAWVSFTTGPGWIGWAPLPPRLSLTYVSAPRYRIDPSRYCFVEERAFLDRRLRNRIVGRDRNARLLASSTNVTRYASLDGGYANRGLAVDRIERATRQRVDRRRIVALGDRGGDRLRVSNDAVAIFKPAVSRRAARPPQEVRRMDKPARSQPAALKPAKTQPAPKIQSARETSGARRATVERAPAPRRETAARKTTPRPRVEKVVRSPAPRREAVERKTTPQPRVEKAVRAPAPRRETVRKSTPQPRVEKVVREPSRRPVGARAVPDTRRPAQIGTSGATKRPTVARETKRAPAKAASPPSAKRQAKPAKPPRSR